MLPHGNPNVPTRLAHEGSFCARAPPTREGCAFMCDQRARGFGEQKSKGAFHEQHAKQKHPQTQGAGVDRNDPSQPPLH